MITPVILSGGTGTRLWPISRKTFPKQFNKFADGKSLFQLCALRLKTSKFATFADPVIVTNNDLRFVVEEQLSQIDQFPGSILIEPEPKNTAPAVLAATIFESRKNPDAILLVAPSDHLIADVSAFHQAIVAGMDQLSHGNIVTFAIDPTGPETGYGYLKLNDSDNAMAVSVDAFIEKPDLAKARDLLNDGLHYWNAGIFLFRARDMLEAFNKLCPEEVNAVSAALDNGQPDLNFFRLDKRGWDDCKKISLDHAIMEHVTNLYAVKYSSHWSDMGSWGAMDAETSAGRLPANDPNSVTAIDCEDVYLRSEEPGLELVGLGLKNIMAVAMRDAVLVMDRNKTQDVGKVVEVLRESGKPQAESFTWEHRPWGRFEVLTEQPGFKVKRVIVKPGGILSLQKHQHRSEHWVVVSGTAKATVDGETKILNDGESTHVPLGAVHRLENPTDEPVILIEVQTGAYLGEDDITRFEDVYSRD